MVAIKIRGTTLPRVCTLSSSTGAATIDIIKPAGAGVQFSPYRVIKDTWTFRLRLIIRAIIMQVGQLFVDNAGTQTLRFRRAFAL
jgi:hypothetical protein